MQTGKIRAAPDRRELLGELKRVWGGRQRPVTRWPHSGKSCALFLRFWALNSESCACQASVPPLAHIPSPLQSFYSSFWEFHIVYFGHTHPTLLPITSLRSNLPTSQLDVLFNCLNNMSSSIYAAQMLTDGGTISWGAAKSPGVTALRKKCFYHYQKIPATNNSLVRDGSSWGSPRSMPSSLSAF